MSELMDLFKAASKQRTQPFAIPKYVDLLGSFDPHIHCREDDEAGDGRMEMVVRACAGQHAVIMDIANVAGVKTIEAMKDRLRTIRYHVPKGSDLRILMAPLINDATDPEMIAAAWDQPEGEEALHALKFFWQGVSNDYGNSISHIDAVRPILALTKRKFVHKKRPPVFTFHAECKTMANGRTLEIKNREFYCIEEQIEPAILEYPEGTYVIRHVSDERTVEWVRYMYSEGFEVHIEIAPQYLLQTTDSIFTSDEGHAMLQCNCVYWPRPKDASSQGVIREEALSGAPNVHVGSDMAKHIWAPDISKGVKLNSKGEAVGGLDLLPSVTKSIIIEMCMQAGKPELIDPLISQNAARVYGITIPDQRYRYVREDWTVPEFDYGLCNGVAIRSKCFLGGQTMQWKRAAA